MTKTTYACILNWCPSIFYGQIILQDVPFLVGGLFEVDFISVMSFGLCSSIILLKGLSASCGYVEKNTLGIFFFQ